jgi:dihydroorotase
MRIEIRGGRVIDPASGHDEQSNVYIEDARIVAIGRALADFTADKIVDAGGQVVCPGLVELGAHVGEPGAEQRGTISSESRAAVAGGITTLCMQPDTDPVIDSPAIVELIRGRADEVNLTRIELLGALTAGLEGDRLAEMYALRTAGCLAATNVRHAIASTDVMRRALDYAATFDMTVFLHCQDPWLSEGRFVHGGSQSFELGLEAIPEAAETVSVARELLLVEQTGARAHFCRLSTGRAVEMVADAQARGLRVTADVGVPYLFLSHRDVDGFDARCHVQPPLRTLADRAALRKALANGTFAALSSDHQPQDLDAKLNPFPMTSPGISGLETLLPLLLRWAEEEQVSLPTALARVTSGPADILNLDRGQLRPGAEADICVFDPNAEVVVEAKAFRSRGKNTPFDRMTLTGQVTTTLVGGRAVYERDSA